MTEKRLRELFTLWQRRLGLERWDVLIKTDPNPELDGHPVLFRCDRSEFYEQATITAHEGVFSPELLPDCTDKDAVLQHGDIHLETQVVHELLHLILSDLTRTSDLVEDQLAPPAVEIWNRAWRRSEERTVDNLARALVRNG